MKFHFKRRIAKAEKCPHSFMKAITASSDLVRQSLSAAWQLGDEGLEMKLGKDG